MIDPELKSHLEVIDRDIKILTKRYAGKWTSFINGILSGMGYVIGFAIAIFLIGWLLNALGYIPALKASASHWQKLLEQTQNRQFVPQNQTNTQQQ